jgi:phosphatidylserine/phosphatidylglycerophosphate/cardiolipin synthase-like enzyme
MRTPITLCAVLVVLPLLAQTPRIRVYFSQDTDPTVSEGTLAISLGQAMDDTIEAYIDRARYTIDVAVYNANDYSIIYALNDARDRGVQVRYITEGAQTNSALPALDPAIPVLERTDGQGSGMHNKFMSIDADHQDLAWTWVGSPNWTQNGLFEDYNNMVFIQDQQLALAYRAEFEEMWGSSGPQPSAANSRFGAEKTDNTPHSFDVDGVLVECYFSPSDGTTARIVDAVQYAQHSVHAALFSFTNSSIGDALLAADALPGCTVRMDLEAPLDPGTEGWYLASNGVDVATHGTDEVQLHHKFAVIDAGTPDDPLVITGSHNWTNFAETINDENILVIHDATVANLFLQEWSARRNDVVGFREGTDAPRVEVWPQPAADLLQVRLPAALQGGTLRLFDAMGRTVRTWNGPGALHSLAVHELSPGVYTLLCADGPARLARTVIIGR